MDQDQNLFKIDQETIKKIQEQNPELIERHDPQYSAQDLTKMGVEIYGLDLPIGYIRFLAQDFVVEEITKEGKICTIEFFNQKIPQRSEVRSQLFAVLVKQGIPTSEAIRRISHATKIPEDQIKYAGLKDAKAVTAQRICLGKISAESLNNLKIDNLFLKDFTYQSGTLEIGDLFGNQFSILVRTQKEIDQIKFDQKLANLLESGFLNFFGIQRFGRRLNSWKIGKLILEKKSQEAVIQFLTEITEYESPYIRQIRQKVKEQNNNWLQIHSLFETMPYYFAHERKITQTLIDNQGNFDLVWTKLPYLLRIFIYSYSSYLFNKLLSRISKSSKPLPETLPLWDNRPEIMKIYQEFLPEENLHRLDTKVSDFIFRGKKHQIKTKIIPKNTKYELIKEGVVISFLLPKGCYATTFLANLFNLRAGYPLPEGLAQNEIDVKKVLKSGSYEATKPYLNLLPEQTQDFLSEEI